MIAAITINTKLPKGREGGKELVLKDGQGFVLMIGKESLDTFVLRVISDPKLPELAKIKLTESETIQLRDVLNLLLTTPNG